MLTTDTKNTVRQLHHLLSMEILEHPNEPILLNKILLSNQEAQELLLHLEARLNQVSLASSPNAKVKGFLSKL